MFNAIIDKLKLILDLSEVWAVLIPLTFLLFNKVNKPSVREIIIYLWVALLLNSIGDVIYFYTEKLPLAFQNSSIYYNIHSPIRVLLFTLYFIRNGEDVLKLQKKMILGFFLAFVAINFIFFESPVALFSSRLFTAEAIVLLFFCIYYFLNAITREKHEKLSRQPIFWIVAGLSIYEAVNFFIFLLYKYLINHYTSLAQHIWDFHNISYIILCLMITKAFYESRQQK